MRGDLHCHTRLSDGSAGMEEVILRAKAAGMSYLSLTDHDSISSFAHAKMIGQRLNVQIIEGVEISGFDYQRKRRVHILCYRPKKPDRLLSICNDTMEMRKEAGRQMAKHVMRHYPITAKEITDHCMGCGCIYRVHIMHALLSAGYTTQIYGDLYRKLFIEEKELYDVPITYPDVREVLQAIRDAGGIAILAHPGVYDSYDLLAELTCENLLDGVEVWHPRNKKGDADRLLSFALEHKLLPTGGSDFHGMYGSEVAPVGKCYTPQKYINKLLNINKESL